MTSYLCSILEAMGVEVLAHRVLCNVINICTPGVYQDGGRIEFSVPAYEHEKTDLLQVSHDYVCAVRARMTNRFQE